VTKDRRLGRGLAALLGTPLEEDGILENGGGRMVEEIPMGAGRATSLKTFSPAVHTSAEAADMSQLNGNRSRTASSRLTAYDANPAAVGVTGSVPLSGRPTAKRTSPTNPSDGDSVPGPTSTDNPLTIQSIEINVSDIENNPFQPRRRFNETEIASLAESIREHEQLQPILVRRVGDRYQLISGERRLRATIHAGRTKIRAEVREADDRLVAELAIVENLQRKDLDPIEKAMSFRRYIDEHQCAQEDLARRLKIDRSTIANLMRLLELPDDLQIHVQNGKLTSGHARTLLPLGHEDEQRQFAAQIMDEGWTVRETERRVAAHLLEQDSQAKARPNANRSGPRKRDTPHVAALEQQIRLSLGTKAEIRQQKTGRGKIVINFNNPEEFERLFAIICPQSTVPTPE
jgi:ParB family transcriptional regulator, chromosome partitioning protein